jgi:DNA-binding beta-propeller fold protein YncE
VGNKIRQLEKRAALLLVAVLALTVASTQMHADTGSCGGTSITLPFTDVPSSNIFFCSIASAYFSGLTAGTSATTYSPSVDVPREQMAAFITRTHDSAIRRSNQRAAAQQWWRPSNVTALRSTSFAAIGPFDLRSIAWDGADLWVTDNNIHSVHRVRASDGKVLSSYFAGDVNPHDIIVAAGYVYVTSLEGSNPGRVYRIDPQISPLDSGWLTLIANDTGPHPVGLTFDGQRLWTANSLGGGSITRVVLSTGIEANFTSGFVLPTDILWDGENLWVADQGADNVKRVDPATGTVLQFVPAGNSPSKLLFDGTNLWVSNTLSDSITVIRAVGGLRGTVLDTITGNGLDAPLGMAFDGERVLVTNNIPLGSVSLFKATDLTPLGNLFTGVNSNPVAACSDGLNFWLVRQGLQDIARF